MANVHPLLKLNCFLMHVYEYVAILWAICIVIISRIELLTTEQPLLLLFHQKKHLIGEYNNIRFFPEKFNYSHNAKRWQPHLFGIKF